MKKHTNKQIDKHTKTSKHKNKQTNIQTNKQTIHLDKKSRKKRKLIIIITVKNVLDESLLHRVNRTKHRYCSCIIVDT